MIKWLWRDSPEKSFAILLNEPLFINHILSTYIIWAKSDT